MKEEIKAVEKEVQEHIQQVEGLIKRLEKHAYSAFRDAAIGGLKTAIEKLPEHVKAIGAEALKKG